MSEEHAVPESPELEALHQRLAENSLGGHWQSREKPAKLKPWVWPWAAIYSCLMESGEVVKLGGIDDAAKRRTVQLVNPAITNLKATSRTIQMSIQLVKPGERAECHRHSAAALRFVVEGDGTGYTNVEGEEMLMEPGDLVLTPNWTWHDHHNESEDPIIWLDGLDGPLIRSLNVLFFEEYEKPEQPVTRETGESLSRLGFARAPKKDETHLRGVPFRYAWQDTYKALKTMSDSERDPYDGTLLRYINPATGGFTYPTMSCEIQLFKAREKTRIHRHTSTALYHVFKGRGRTAVGEGHLEWKKGDSFVVPLWQPHSHENLSDEEAILFSINDRPVMEALQLYREEAGN